MEAAAMRKASPQDDTRKRASFGDTLRTVLAGAIGVRRRADHERAPLNPVHVIIAAFIFVALFIFTLVMVVRIVTG
jgi:hypothetical protein